MKALGDMGMNHNDTGEAHLCQRSCMAPCEFQPLLSGSNCVRYSQTCETGLFRAEAAIHIKFTGLSSHICAHANTSRTISHTIRMQQLL